MRRVIRRIAWVTSPSVAGSLSENARCQFGTHGSTSTVYLSIDDKSRYVLKASGSDHASRRTIRAVPGSRMYKETIRVANRPGGGCGHDQDPSDWPARGQWARREADVAGRRTEADAHGASGAPSSGRPATCWFAPRLARARFCANKTVAACSWTTARAAIAAGA
jgi:hypothetical protein